MGLEVKALEKYKIIRMLLISKSTEGAEYGFRRTNMEY